VAEVDEQNTIHTVMDLTGYDRESGQARFQQRLPEDHEGSFHSFAMAKTDWDALGRPVSITMTLAPGED
jgi:hypothetical protein